MLLVEAVLPCGCSTKQKLNYCMSLGTLLQTDISCLPHAEEGFGPRGCACMGQAFSASRQHTAKLRPEGFWVVSHRHGNPFQWASARGKILLEEPALQLNSSLAGIIMALQREQPDSSLCAARKCEWCSPCSGGSQVVSEAPKFGSVYFVQCPLLLFLSLDESHPDCIPWTGKVPWPGSRCSELHEHQGVSESSIPVQGWRELSPRMAQRGHRRENRSQRE